MGGTRPALPPRPSSCPRSRLVARSCLPESFTSGPAAQRPVPCDPPVLLRSAGKAVPTQQSRLSVPWPACRRTSQRIIRSRARRHAAPRRWHVAGGRQLRGDVKSWTAADAFTSTRAPAAQPNCLRSARPPPHSPLWLSVRRLSGHSSLGGPTVATASAGDLQGIRRRLRGEAKPWTATRSSGSRGTGAQKKKEGIRPGVCHAAALRMPPLPPSQHTHTYPQLPPHFIMAFG